MTGAVHERKRIFPFPAESLCDFRQGGFERPIAQDLNFRSICTTCEANKHSHAQHQKKKMNELRHECPLRPELFPGTPSATIPRPTTEDCLLRRAA
jgi:hypothetical protein